MNAEKLFKAMGGLSLEAIKETSGRMVLMVVTPEIASSWLGNLYERQRKKNGSAEAIYMQSMSAGHWKISNDAITITKKGECINGQHRLMAVVKNGEPIVAWVLLDAEPDMYDIIDNIYARSAGQVLDCPNRNDVAALAKAIVVIESGKTFSAALRSTMTIPRWMISERAESDMEYLQKLVRVSKATRKYIGIGSGAAYGLAIHVFAEIHEEFDVEDSIEYLSTADITTLSLQRTVQRKLQQQKTIKKDWILGSMFQFLEAKIEGRQIKRFSNHQSFVRRYEQLYESIIQKRGQ